MLLSFNHFKQRRNKMSKMTLDDLQENNHTFKLVHPKRGELNATVTILSPRSNEYFFKAVELSRKPRTEATTFEEAFNDNINLLSSIVYAWDESFFKCECTTDNVKKVLSKISNNWIVKQIEAEMVNEDNFFQNS